MNPRYKFDFLHINSFFNKAFNRAISVELSQENNVTVVLNVWKRRYLEEQLKSIFTQTIRPSAIWIIQYENHFNVNSILNKYSGLEYLYSSLNLKYFGRFSFANHAKTDYIWILDDDVIPGIKWLENSLAACERHDAIVSSAGRIIPRGQFYLRYRPENESYFVGDITKNTSYNFCQEDTIVDFGCNGWLIKTDWLEEFWAHPPLTLDMAEDIHLSAVCKSRLGVNTIVLKQTCEETSGNLKIAYGRDQFASWTKPGFYDLRKIVLEYLINELKWKPLLW